MLNFKLDSSSELHEMNRKRRTDFFRGGRHIDLQREDGQGLVSTSIDGNYGNFI